MTAHCFVETCSLTWDEVVGDFGPAYSGSVRLDPNSSVTCVEPLTGLDVKIADPVLGNILARSGTGILSAHIPAIAHVAHADDNYIAVPSGADSAAPALADLLMSYTNPTDQEQLLIVRGQFELHYDITWEGNPETDPDLERSGDIVTRDPGPVGGIVPSRQLTPFNAQVAMRLLQAVGAGAYSGQLVEHMNLSGMVDTNVVGGNQRKSEYRNFNFLVPIAAGATHHYKADVFFDGPDQTLNMLARPAAQGAGRRGFRVSGADIFAFPMQVVEV